MILLFLVATGVIIWFAIKSCRDARGDGLDEDTARREKASDFEDPQLNSGRVAQFSTEGYHASRRRSSENTLTEKLTTFKDVAEAEAMDPGHQREDHGSAVHSQPNSASNKKHVRILGMAVSDGGVYTTLAQDV